MSSSLLESAFEGKVFKNKYYYIAHLLDKVIIGEKDDVQWEKLVKAYKDLCLLEIHLFNEEMEIFAVRVNGELKEYEEMKHEKESEKVITRTYEIDRSLLNKSDYTHYEVKEYIEYDEATHMADVEKTVLYGLGRI